MTERSPAGIERTLAALGAVALALLAFIFLYAPLSDQDLWWHLKAGWLVNTEDRERRPAKLLPGDPLPPEAGLPEPQELASAGQGWKPETGRDEAPPEPPVSGPSPEKVEALTPSNNDTDPGSFHVSSPNRQEGAGEMPSGVRRPGNSRETQAPSRGSFIRPRESFIRRPFPWPTRRVAPRRQPVPPDGSTLGVTVRPDRSDKPDASR